MSPRARIDPLKSQRDELLEALFGSTIHMRTVKDLPCDIRGYTEKGARDAGITRRLTCPKSLIQILVEGEKQGRSLHKKLNLIT